MKTQEHKAGDKHKQPKHRYLNTFPANYLILTILLKPYKTAEHCEKSANSRNMQTRVGESSNENL